jgi:acyl-CoA dehydrogenase
MSEPSMIGDAVAKMLAQAQASAASQGSGAATDTQDLDLGLWQTLVESGVPRLLRPESQGGAGNAFRDASEVLQAVGMHAPAVPLTDTLLAHLLLSRASIDLSDARPIRLRVAAPDGTPDVGAPAASAQSPSGPELTHLLEVDPWGDEVVMTWYPQTDASSTTAGAASGRTLRSAETAMVQGLLAMAGASVLTGAMMRAMAMAIEWAGTRVQFGRPIGQFQAIQHSLALAAEELAASRAALDWAAQELEVGRPMPAAAIAKTRAAEAAGKVAAITHQVHGAIGFTAEFSLFRSTQQLWLWRDRWGDEHHWNAWLGRQALAAGPDGLFDLIMGESGQANLRA